jgi:phosphoglycerate dehydrogenase-like enzyme
MGGKWLVVNVEPMDNTGESYRILRKAGCELVLGRDGWKHPGDGYTEEELIELCKSADAIIGCSRDRYTRRLIQAIPNLRVISKHGAGTEKIDIKAATERGILVTHTPVNSVAVAEHTIALILAGLKKIREADRKVRNGGWRDDDLLTTLVNGKTLGIVGFGRIGMEITKRFQGWGLTILVYDPYVKRETLAPFHAERCSDLGELLERVDIVSLNVALTAETRRMINEEALGKLKKTAYIVNTSRGEVIDENALVRALREGRLMGAALDVLEREPPGPDHPLLDIDRTLITPHVSAWTPEMTWLLTYTAVENVLAALKGEVPKYVKNPEVIDQWLARFGRGMS